MKVPVFWYSTICPLVNVLNISAKHAASYSGSISPSGRRYFPPKRRKTTHQQAGCNIPEDLNLQHRRENLSLHTPYINKIHQAENFALHHLTKRTLCRALYPSRCSEVARLLLTIWSELATNTLSQQTGPQEAHLIMGPKLNAHLFMFHGYKFVGKNYNAVTSY